MIEGFMIWAGVSSLRYQSAGGRDLQAQDFCIKYKNPDCESYTANSGKSNLELPAVDSAAAKLLPPRSYSTRQVIMNELELQLKKAMPQLGLKNGLALYCSHTNCLRKQVSVDLLKITNKLKLKLKKAGMLNRSRTQYSRKQITVNQWKLTNKPKRKLKNALPLYRSRINYSRKKMTMNVEAHKQTEAHAEKHSRCILLPHDFFQKSNMGTG